MGRSGHRCDSAPTDLVVAADHQVLQRQQPVLQHRQPLFEVGRCLRQGRAVMLPRLRHLKLPEFERRHADGHYNGKDSQ
jgi:hypothetical protein